MQIVLYIISFIIAIISFKRLYHYGISFNRREILSEYRIDLLVRNSNFNFPYLSLEHYSERGQSAIDTLEEKLGDIDIQPKPEAQYVVYNRVPKVSI